MGEQEETEIGFDEGEGLASEDVVVLEQADGSTLEAIVLTIVEVDDATFAVLVDRHASEDAELMVTLYREDADGTAHFEPVPDDASLDGLQDVLDMLAPG